MALEGCGKDEAQTGEGRLGHPRPESDSWPRLAHDFELLLTQVCRLHPSLPGARTRELSHVERLHTWA